MKKKLLSLFLSLTMVVSLFSGIGALIPTVAMADEEAAVPTEIYARTNFVTLATGESEQINASVLPANADQAIIWTSSDEKVAVVDESGKITALTIGDAIITAASADGSVSVDIDVQTRFNDTTKGDVSEGNYKTIYWAVENGYINGFNKGEYFGPTESITRQQFVTIMWRMAGRPSVTLPAKSPFSDVDTSSSTYKAIVWAANEGIVKGYSDGTFGPEQKLTRKQAVIMLWRIQGRPASEKAADFSDVKTTDSAYKAIAWSSENGIIRGYSDGTFGSDKDCERQNFTTILYRYVKKFVSSEKTVKADDAIEKVYTIGFVDADGAKPSAVIVKYNEALFDAEVSADTFDVWAYMQEQANSCELGENPAAVTKVYVNDVAEADENGGAGWGKFVIIELNTDYQLNQSKKYYLAMAAEVKQVAAISGSNVTVEPATEAVVNYYINEYDQTGRNGQVTHVIDKVVNPGAYMIDEIGRYDIGIVHTEHAFEEATGEYVDLDLDYALFVPEDYDASKKYMMVLHIEDAGNLGTDARIGITEAQTPVNLVVDEMQDLAKEQGYGGVIVLVPQISNAYRSTRDNYTFSAAVYATWDIVDQLIENYNIDTDRIYGSGQSMGGMQVLEMAVQRDNFFAGILATGCQWGQNYNQEQVYGGSVYYEAPADGKYIWTVDANGNPCDYRNFYYLLSDDNVLCSNCLGDAFSSTVWKELAFLYKDLAGVEIPKTVWNPLTTPVEEQNAALEALFEEENEIGIWWNAFEGGNHMATWVYADRVTAMYKWLLNQTRESEMERGKLDCLANDFELAEEQIHTEDRLIYEDTENPENSVYFVTGKAGAGTAGYNSGQFSPRGGKPNANPGWTVDVVETETFVTDAEKTILDTVENAETIIPELLEAGKITVNDVVIEGEVAVNGAPALWKNEDGTWGWKTHIMYKGESESYETAAYDFVIGMSKLRGPAYTVTTTNGEVTAIDFSIYDAAMAETVTIGEETTTLTICGPSDGSMLRTDPGTIAFPNENIVADSEGKLPANQNLVLYWEDADGWHLQRADSKKVAYTSAYEYVDTRINLEYSQSWNRPTQPIFALRWLGLQDAGIEMVEWFYNGYTVGFSHVNSKDVLAQAIALSEAALANEELKVSDEDRALFTTAVEAAKAVAEGKNLLSTDYESAILKLAASYGGDGGRYTKNGNVFSDGVGFINRTTE